MATHFKNFSDATTNWNGQPVTGLLSFPVGRHGTLGNVIYKANQTAVDLTIFPDTSLDSAKNPELGVTMDKGTIEIRDSITTQLIQTLGAP